MAPTTAPPVGATTPPAGAKVDWSKVPPVTAPPRPGMFSIPPTGPGYYSLWDVVTGNEREAAPVAPYAPYALTTTPLSISISAIGKPGYEQDLFDPLKRIQLGDDFLLSFGGSFWYRYMQESDPRLTKTNDNYHMIRSRFHADFWFQDKVRLIRGIPRCAYLRAGPDTPPTDVNHTDMLNLFADVKWQPSRMPRLISASVARNCCTVRSG